MSSPRPTLVTADLQLRLVVPGSSALPVRASMRYDVTDPYAVTVAFYTGAADASGDVVEWTFARQLLTDGVSAPVGEGDVQVWPSSSSGAPVVCLALSSPSGKALFEVPLPELVDFLGSTYAAVPTGGESAHVDVDAELALLLWAEPET
ncbi:MAG TPA: SsgA family sporulation/cell division regulator [Mycobacteriales bacterium]|nr:SsgA family sporulation/cell division regulator [Mycobacteriales bacterium]